MSRQSYSHQEQQHEANLRVQRIVNQRESPILSMVESTSLKILGIIPTAITNLAPNFRLFSFLESLHRTSNSFNARSFLIEGLLGDLYAQEQYLHRRQVQGLSLPQYLHETYREKSGALLREFKNYRKSNNLFSGTLSEREFYQLPTMLHSFIYSLAAPRRSLAEHTSIVSLLHQCGSDKAARETLKNFIPDTPQDEKILTYGTPQLFVLLHRTFKDLTEFTIRSSMLVDFVVSAKLQCSSKTMKIILSNGGDPWRLLHEPLILALFEISKASEELPRHHRGEFRSRAQENIGNRRFRHQLSRLVSQYIDSDRTESSDELAAALSDTDDHPPTAIPQMMAAELRFSRIEDLTKRGLSYQDARTIIRRAQKIGLGSEALAEMKIACKQFPEFEKYLEDILEKEKVCLRQSSISSPGSVAVTPPPYRTPLDDKPVSIAFDSQTSFLKWLESLDRSRAVIVLRELRKLDSGNLLHTKRIRPNLSELKIAGLRIYFTYPQENIIFLINGGSKRTQDADIEYALRSAKQFNMDCAQEFFSGESISGQLQY